MKFDLLVEQILIQLNEATAESVALELYNKAKSDLKKILKTLKGEEKLQKLRQIRNEFKKNLITVNYKGFNDKTEDEKETIVDNLFEFMKKRFYNSDEDQLILSRLKGLQQVAFIPKTIPNALKKPIIPKLFSK